MTMSDFDKENVGQILSGQGTWFTAKLMRLVCESDSQCKEKMWHGFPEVVDAVHQFQTGKTWTEVRDEQN